MMVMSSACASHFLYEYQAVNINDVAVSAATSRPSGTSLLGGRRYEIVYDIVLI